MIGLLLLLGAGSAQAGAPVAATLHGDAKSFFFASFPYDHLLFVDAPATLTDVLDPEVDPSGQALVNGRLKLDMRGFDRFKLQLHGVVAASAPGGFGGGGFVQTGLGTPQAVDLSWQAVSGSGLDAWTRIDRASLTVQLPQVDLSLGRQPVTLGRALFFTPLDLVGPFSPTVTDQEYKPGVDAFRVDAYAGAATQITAIAAYGAPAPGDWAAADWVLVALGQTTVGLWDLGLFVGSVHQDLVLGLSSAGSVGPVGLRAEGSLTRPPGAADPYVRGVVGGDWVRGDLSLSGEAYYQGVGAADPADYLQQASGPRYARAELWALGRWYGAFSAGYVLFPRLSGSLAVIANLADPSALLAPGLRWSVSDESEVLVGGYVGLGQRPGQPSLPALARGDLVGAIPVHSEFGLMPATFFLQWASRF